MCDDVPTRWESFRSGLTAKPLKSFVPVAAGYAVFFVGYIAWTVLWNWDQGVGVFESLVYLRSVGIGLFVTTLVPFLIGLLVVDRLEEGSAE